MQSDQKGGSIVGRSAALLITLVLVATHCHAQAKDRYPTSGNLRGGGPQDTVQAILDYGRSLSLNRAFNEEEGATDAQRLLLGGCPPEARTCTSGPLATLQPRARHGNWEVATPRDTGEIVARILSDQSDQPYRVPSTKGDSVYKFNIHGRDTVYWWIGPKRPGDSALVSIFVSTRSRRPLVSNLEYTQPPHRTPYWQLGIARWIWSIKDELVWVTCDGGRCCRSDGLELQQ